jgi:GntR family transcriptional repressor for pyruvate dehydrogenase complex
MGRARKCLWEAAVNTNAPVRLPDRVATALLDMIRDEGYKVGDCLPSEHTLCSTLGVSRIVVREAIAKLKADGIVTSRRGLGLFVASTRVQSARVFTQPIKSDLGSLLYLVELRRGVEAEAASLAARRRRPEDLKSMQSALDAMASALERNDVSAGVNADLAFHQAIYVATSNPYYLQFIKIVNEPLVDAIKEARQRSALSSSRGSQAQLEHIRIFDAVRVGNPRAARAAATQQVDHKGSRRSGAVGAADTA